MEPIRRKIWLVVVLLIAAIVVSGLIYSKGGFGVVERKEQAVLIDIDPIQPDEFAGNNIEGMKLFKTHCTSCHAMEKILTGPALMGIAERAPSKAFIEDILINPKDAVKKYSYATALSKSYGDGAHISFAKTLTHKDVADIITFLWYNGVEPVQLQAH